MDENIDGSHNFYLYRNNAKSAENVQRVLPFFCAWQGRGGYLPWERETLLSSQIFFLRENCDWIIGKIRQEWQESTEK